MRLKQFKEYIESFDKNTVFKYSLSEPFSWRGSYDQVAFSLDREATSTAQEVLDKISKAYTDLFWGYKGGTFRYNDATLVNFEPHSYSYTDGDYVKEMIAYIEGNAGYSSQEDRLVHLAFN